jgi:hypothetical protein
MAIRPLDHDFAADERLYRRLTIDDVDEHGVRPDSLRFTDTSCDREMHLAGEHSILLNATHPAENGYASIRAGDFPIRVSREAGPDLVAEPADDPRADNPAHCEIRVCRQGLPFDRELRVGSASKREMKWRIATKMRVCLAPRQVDTGSQQ